MNILKNDFKRAFLNKTMFFAVLIGLITVAIGMYMVPIKGVIALYLENATDITEDQKYHLIYNGLNKVTLWNFGHYIYPFVMPLICCIPFTAAYIEDKNSGFNKFIIIRSSYKKYISSRIITTFLSGFFTIFIVGSISYIFMLILDSGDAYRSLYVLDETFLSNIHSSNFDLFAFIYILITSLMGGVYALLGLAISSVTCKKLIAVISPFILYYAGSYILSIFQNIYLFDPLIVNKFTVYSVNVGRYIFIQLSILFIFSLLVFLYKTYWSDCHE